MANPCKALHETFLKDIFDIAKEIEIKDPEEFFDGESRSPMARTSLARKTSGLVMVFPLMVSSSLTIDTAVMLMKAHERKCATMVQLLFSAYTASNFEDMESELRTFHRNINLSKRLTVDTAIDLMNHLSETGVLQPHEPEYSKLQAVKEDMKNIFFYFEENVNPRPLSNFNVSHGPDGYFTEELRDRRHGLSAVNRNIKPVDHTKALTPTDVKKANELVPTMLTVNFYAETPNGKYVCREDAMIGIKCRLVPVQSNDIINHIVSKTSDSNWLFNLIRATTREISFIKDFLLAMDQAKVDALANTRRGSADPMWKVLERRAMGSKWKRLIGSSNAYMAITSLAVSQEDVDYMLKEHNVDFRSPSVINILFDKYNLMACMIADESLEVANFMYDTGEGNWEALSFTALEREDKDNTYKKVVNLMTKVAR